MKDSRLDDFLTVMGLLALFVVGVVFFFHIAEPVNNQSPEIEIIILGDSICKGDPAAHGQSYADAWTSVSFCRSGEGTTHFREFINENDVITKYNSKKLVLQSFTNDVFGSTESPPISRQEYFYNILYISNYTESKGAKFFLMYGFPYGGRMDEVNEAADATQVFCQAANLTCIDVRPTLDYYNESLYSNPAHPNVKGHEKLGHLFISEVVLND